MKKNGYTLIEILIVLVIISTLFIAGYVSFRNYARTQALLSVLRSLQTDIRVTQQSANSGNKPVSCSGLLNGYQINFTSATTYEIDAVCTTGNVQTKNVTLPLDFTISPPNPNPIVFKSLAQGTNITLGSTANILITQTSTNSSKTVIISPGGGLEQ